MSNRYCSQCGDSYHGWICPRCRTCIPSITVAGVVFHAQSVTPDQLARIEKCFETHPELAFWGLNFKVR